MSPTIHRGKKVLHRMHENIWGKFAV